MSHIENKSNGRKSSDAVIKFRQGMDCEEGLDSEVYPMQVLQYLLATCHTRLALGTRSSIWPANMVTYMQRSNSRTSSWHGLGRYNVLRERADRDAQYNKVA